MPVNDLYSENIVEQALRSTLPIITPRAERSQSFDPQDVPQLMDAISTLAVTGHTQREIADRFNITQQQVQRYIDSMRKEWARANPHAVRRVVTIQLQKLDAIESEVWRAWRKSLEPSVTVEEEVSDQFGARTKTTTTPQSGNPSYTKQLMDLCELRLKIVGGFAPTRINVTWQKELEKSGADARQLFNWLVGAVLAERRARLVEGQLSGVERDESPAIDSRGDPQSGAS